jgi:aromatic-L-amino-acid decarboxylase
MAGTTNTGSVDDLMALRRIADQESIWLHVDAAYGGGMLLSQTSPDLLKGLEQADSVTMDPHKWFYAPLDAGAVLVKNDERLTRSFGLQPAYLTEQKDTEGERYQYFVHSFEQSRRFRSLKIWMSFKRYGLKEIGRWIDANVEQAHHLYDMVSAHPDFEAVVEPVMSAICIRYTGRAMDDAARTALHHDVVQQIEESGKFWISTTVLKGKTYFRINPVNFRTRQEHIDGLFDMLCTACENVN